MLPLTVGLPCIFNSKLKYDSNLHINCFINVRILISIIISSETQNSSLESKVEELQRIIDAEKENKPTIKYLQEISSLLQKVHSPLNTLLFLWIYFT